jgi:hypothetical protein
MGRAFKSDVLEAPQIAEEIVALRQRADILEPETVNCPIEGCRATFQMYNYIFSDADANREALLYGLRIHHPHHNQPSFILNELRGGQ